MKKNLLITTFLVLSAFNLIAQFNILKNITSDEYNGLGSTFDFQVNDAKDLVYFEASPNQFDFTIWKTDGSPNGTVQSLSLSSTDAISFTKNGIFVEYFNNGRKLLITKGSDATNVLLPFFDGKKVGSPFPMGNKTLLIGTATKDIYVTDGTNAGSKLVKSLSEINYNLEITTNDSLALIFDNYSFGPDFTPFLYQSNSDKTIDLIQYLKPYKTFSSISYAYIFNELIMFQGVEDGFQVNYVFNVNSKQLKSFDFIRKLVSGSKMSNGDYLILSERYLHRINPNSLVFEEIFSEVYPFTSSLFYDDKLYFIGDPFGGEDSYYVSDGTISGTTKLAGTEIGTDYYESRSLIHKNDLYYFISKGSFFNSANYLMKYDFDSKSVDTIGQIEEPAGGAVYNNGMVEINGKLLVSIFTKKEGHELYRVDTETNTLELLNEDKYFKIHPTISNFQLNVISLNKINCYQIIDIDGNVIREDYNLPHNNETIDVSNLSAGLYVVKLIDNKGNIASKKFIKSL